MPNAAAAVAADGPGGNPPAAGRYRAIRHGIAQGVGRVAVPFGEHGVAKQLLYRLAPRVGSFEQTLHRRCHPVFGGASALPPSPQPAVYRLAQALAQNMARALSASFVYP